MFASGVKSQIINVELENSHAPYKIIDVKLSGIWEWGGGLRLSHHRYINPSANTDKCSPGFTQRLCLVRVTFQSRKKQTRCTWPTRGRGRAEQMHPHSDLSVHEKTLTSIYATLSKNKK